MFNLAKDHPVLKVVNDQFGKPTYTLDLAKQTRQLIEANPAFGVYHLTNETQPGGISWYQFSREIFKQACALGLIKDLPQVKPCLSQEFLRPARRPHFSVLNNTRLPKSRVWQKALFDYLTLLTEKS